MTTLKLIRCHRAADSLAFRRAVKAFPDYYTTIPKGPLKGCLRRVHGTNMRSVYKLGRGYVLEFVVCIRVKL